MIIDDDFRDDNDDFRDFFDDLDELWMKTSVIIYLINKIDASNDKDEIQKAFDDIAKIEFPEKRNIKQDILAGSGDFSKINKKLIEYGIS